jgi:hypothetical protein
MQPVPFSYNKSCVQAFDHHCIWFNNCVGKGNYFSFFVSIVALFVHLALFVAHLIVGTVGVVREGMVGEVVAVLAAGWVMGAVVVVFDFLLLNLIGLHLYLMIEEMTTYDFLTREKKEGAQKVVYMGRSHSKISP